MPSLWLCLHYTTSPPVCLTIDLPDLLGMCSVMFLKSSCLLFQAWVIHDIGKRCCAHQMYNVVGWMRVNVHIVLIWWNAKYGKILGISMDVFHLTNILKKFIYLHIHSLWYKFTREAILLNFIWIVKTTLLVNLEERCYL